MSECIEWKGAVNSSGYGSTSVNGVTDGVHRHAYREANGEIPDGFVIDHLCCNKRCINPEHLEAVTHGENIKRGKGTHCKNGHERNEENTYMIRGTRQCKACHLARQKAYYDRKVGK